ncbi:MAG: energy-coupled thiamine transporter ThiT [Lachnospiraceae bacterium]|nr:energy-coupled thiamine transporter ThiT [Lachnospiraceae bacterium]
MELFTQEDGYYALTSLGTALIFDIIELIIVLFILRVRTSKEDRKSSVISARQLVYCSAALAIGFILSFVKIVHLPWGGSVTLCSMLFITLIGYWYGPRIGLMAAFAYGLLQFVQGGGSYMLSPLQVCMDYIFAFTALGLAGFFSNKKHGLVTGYIVAILVRGLFHSIGGYLFWMDYMPEDFPKALTFAYPIIYNYAYILLEGALTVVILLFPAVRNALARVKETALS